VYNGNGRARHLAMLESGNNSFDNSAATHETERDADLVKINSRRFEIGFDALEGRLAVKRFAKMVW
jgi:hypothetical protein